MNEVNLFEVGQIIKNDVGQYAKIINITEEEKFLLSGWTSLKGALESTVANISLNIFGMQSAGAVITDEVSEDATSDDTKVTKKALKKLDLNALVEIANKVQLEVSEDDTKATLLEKLYTHFEL